MFKVFKMAFSWLLVFFPQTLLFAEGDGLLEEFFSSNERFKREAPGIPWTVTKEEEEFILAKLASDDFPTQLKFLDEIKLFRINTLKIREALLGIVDNPKYQNVKKISNDTYGSLSGEASSALAKLYSISSYTQGATDGEWRIELKRQLNNHPDFEGRFTKELTNRERPEKKPLVRPDSSSEKSTGAQSNESSQKPSIENPSSFAWIYWVLGVLIMGGVGVLVWSSRKGSSAS